MHNLFCGVILLSKLLCALHILEYAEALNIVFPKNSSFIFRLCKRSNKSTELYMLLHSLLT
ncbi:hypothetical protein [Candidatus Sarmatiella mevalonica]|uniref:hypothetical protein n=1 Tax=Candidatus Sarmatiella mevalonica TaxID=2770581 RepID=UPI0019212771|nr:hypothetical protein [Candidatus Sarmatiella mevalonica]